MCVLYVKILFLFYTHTSLGTRLVCTYVHVVCEDSVPILYTCPLVSEPDSHSFLILYLNLQPVCTYPELVTPLPTSTGMAQRDSSGNT